MENSLSNFKGAISPKKLRRNIKKATRALLSGIKVSPGKKQEEKTKVLAQ
jgi:hypothetical protein